MKKFNDNIIVSLNKFEDDNIDDINKLRDYLNNKNIKLCISTMYTDGEYGCIELAKEIINLKDNNKEYSIYNLDDSLFDKIEKIKEIYGCKNVVMSDEIKNKIEEINKKHSNLPICICKTPYSISDNEKLINYPKDFDMTITDIKVFNGAGYIVIYMGNVLLMPGLAKESNYLKDVYHE